MCPVILDHKSVVLILVTIVLTCGISNISYGQAAPIVAPGADDTSLRIEFTDSWNVFDFNEAYYVQYRKKTPQGSWKSGCVEIGIALDPLGGGKSGTVEVIIYNLDPGTTYQVRYNRNTGKKFCVLVKTTSGPWSEIGEGTTSGTAPTVQQQPQPAGEITYNVGEDIPTLPTGFWTPDVTSGASFVFSGGEATIDFKNGGQIEEAGITYTCVAAGGCTIEGRRVTSGTIQTTGGQPPPPAQQPDLVLESVEAHPSTVDPGSEFRLYATLKNQGTAQSAATTVRYYRSTDNVISTTDTQLGTGRRNPLAANVSIRRFLDVTAPTTPGIYYYGVCVDSVPNESNTTNNCSAAVSVTVSSQTTPPSTGMLSASTTTPLTEATLNDSVVTLTLNGGNYEPSYRIRNALQMSGIAGVSFRSYRIDRVSDTEVTVELEFDGNMDTNGMLTFTIGADAISNYNGPPLTVQVPVTAVTESIVASTDTPLTEATLHESVVTLTLTGRKFDSYRYYDALTVSGIDGVTFRSWDVDRTGDTEVTVELTFSGNIDTDTMLTFSVGATGIEDYNGPALTAQIPVAAGTEWVVASTALPLTKATLDGSIVMLTLSGSGYERWSSDIRNAVTVSGVAGVTIEAFSVERVSDVQIAVELEFDSTIDPFGMLTFTVEAGAIANYNGPAVTAQLAVPTQLEDSEAGDVNSDGAVSIQDLVLVASSFGQTGQHPADINGDGVVDVKDLIVVAGVLDSTAAAPSLHPDSYEGLTAADVRRWLSEAQGFNLTDATSQQGILFLENLLMVLSPKETILLANYPNPFNPETWIPYQLANDSDVSLSIYDINGALVRELDLGLKPAGYYTDRTKAAYWDGRNEWGEQVASGVYFYYLQAGDYSQMRKLVILK